MVLAMSKDKSVASSSKGGGELEELLNQLGINEEDLDDVVFEDEIPPPAEATRWMIIARVYTKVEYSGSTRT